MAKKKKGPVGRPPKSDSDRLGKTINVRMSPAEHDALRELAAQEGRSLSATLVVAALGRRIPAQA